MSVGVLFYVCVAVREEERAAREADLPNKSRRSRDPPTPFFIPWVPSSQTSASLLPALLCMLPFVCSRSVCAHHPEACRNNCTATDSVSAASGGLQEVFCFRKNTSFKTDSDSGGTTIPAR